jgi:membrane protease subunit (stomatin/prohibitin family)
MVRTMFDRLITRQIAAMIVALGVFLGGAAPAWASAAMPVGGSMSPAMSMMMPGMDMSNNCMGSQDKGSPGKQAPCKSTDNSCAVCAGCAINVGLAPNFSPVALICQRSAGLFVADAKPDGLTTPPALPPPILRA